MTFDKVIEKILGDNYNEDEVEANFGLKSLIIKSVYIKPEKEVLFKIQDDDIVNESVLRNYRYYHDYLKNRNITEDTANKYDIGFDNMNKQITFPIKNIYNECLAIGRRSINNKIYRYPLYFQKPLYGIYELPRFIKYLWIVEGPFNLWSLYQYNKAGVALLGTGTEKQYKQLLSIKCEGYVCCLDPDEAGRKGTRKLIDFLLEHNRDKIYVTLIPEGKDVNDLTESEFRNVEVINYKEWLKMYN